MQLLLSRIRDHTKNGVDWRAGAKTNIQYPFDYHNENVLKTRMNNFKEIGRS